MNSEYTGLIVIAGHILISIIVCAGATITSKHHDPLDIEELGPMMALSIIWPVLLIAWIIYWMYLIPSKASLKLKDFINVRRK